MPEYQPGDICKFTNPKPGARHPFAILGKCDSDNYLGCMITHGDPKDWLDNKPMGDGDFVDKDENGTPYKVRYSVVKGIGSHFVSADLKKHTELDVYKAGQLTIEGLKKLSEVVKGEAPELWDIYDARSKAQKLKQQENHRQVKDRPAKGENA